MKSYAYLLATAASLAGSATATGISAADFGMQIQAVSPCGKKCIDDTYATGNPCMKNDVTCGCDNATFKSSVATCVVSKCPNDAIALKAKTDALCAINANGGSTSMNTSANSAPSPSTAPQMTPAGPGANNGGPPAPIKSGASPTPEQVASVIFTGAGAGAPSGKAMQGYGGDTYGSYGSYGNSPPKNPLADPFEHGPGPVVSPPVHMTSTLASPDQASTPSPVANSSPYAPYPWPGNSSVATSSCSTAIVIPSPTSTADAAGDADPSEPCPSDVAASDADPATTSSNAAPVTTPSAAAATPTDVYTTPSDAVATPTDAASTMATYDGGVAGSGLSTVSFGLGSVLLALAVGFVAI